MSRASKPAPPTPSSPDVAGAGTSQPTWAKAPEIRYPRRTAKGLRSIPIQFPDDAVLDVDSEGRDILRFGLSIRERGTRNRRTVHFDFPTLGQWPDYQRACAGLFALLSECVPDFWLPDDMEALARDPEGYRTWAAVVTVVCRRRIVADALVAIPLTFLDPMVDGMEEGHKEWVLANVGMGDMVDMLAVILLTDDLLEKKTRSALMGIFQTATPQRSSADSVNSPAAPRRKSSAIPMHELDFS